MHDLSVFLLVSRWCNSSQCSYVAHRPLWIGELSTHGSVAACHQRCHCICFYTAASALNLYTAAKTRSFACRGPPSDILSYLLLAGQVFTAWRYASALYVMALCPSVHLSVTRRYSIETAENIELVFGTEVSVGLSYSKFNAQTLAIT